MPPILCIIQRGSPQGTDRIPLNGKGMGRE